MGIFGKSQIRLEMDGLLDVQKSLRKQIIELETKVKVHTALIAAGDKKSSLDKTKDTPWVEMIGIASETDKGIQIELDWNDAFIRSLQDNNITGATDDEIVQKWLAFLYQDVIEKLENKVDDEPSPISVVPQDT